ncbi:hypothetical protein [Actinomadura sp. GTD37]|uniref:hypothetical protein n=1 Tax=Actinomadura sp. GTD37 TaxID=1778030 RepID=UPI0035C2014D
MGHAVTEARPVIDWEAVMQCTTATAVACASALLLSPSRPDPARLEAVSRQLLRVAKEHSALDMMAAFGAQNRVTRSVGAFFRGQPAISLPLGGGDGGPPVGVQIIAPYGREDLLFRIADRLEQAMPWDHRTPRISVRRR